MKTFKIEVDISVPKEEVWDCFVDMENYKKWNPTIPFGKGELIVGNFVELRWKRVKPNWTIRLTPKIEAIRVHQQFTFSTRILHNRIAKMIHHFEFEETEDGKTKFIQRWECTGFLLPLLWRLLLPGFKEFENFSFALKDYLEDEEL